MALRGKPPIDQKRRLKMLLSGPAGEGKTTAAIQMPKPYVIDSEAGTTHYGKIITASNGVVFAAKQPDEIIRELRSLISEPHDYLTVVLDSITPVWDMALDEGERKVGTEWGRHYGYATKQWKRIFSLLTTVDMNVIVTAHQKDDYQVVETSKGEKERAKVGVTYEGFKGMDYAFDLWLKLARDPVNGKTRWATVAKTRLDSFPDQSRFEWSYQAISDRYGKALLETGVSTVALASPEQVAEFSDLLKLLTEDEQKALKIDKALAAVEDVADLPAERISKAIAFVKAYKAQKLPTLEK